MAWLEGIEAAHQNHLDRHELLGLRCWKCGEVLFPPRPVCPNCLGTEMDWTGLSGQGKLTSFTIIHVGLPDRIDPDVPGPQLYCSGIVRLKEGPSLCSLILQVDCSHPETIRVGLDVQAGFLPDEPNPANPAQLVFYPVTTPADST